MSWVHFQSPLFTSELLVLKGLGALDSESDSPSPLGVQTLCPVERDGIGQREALAGLGERCISKSGNEGTGEHQYPVMVAWETYCNRNAEIAQDRQVYFLASLIQTGKQWA